MIVNDPKQKRKRLCTFPGCNGDCLWSLATAREFARLDGQPVDFAIRGDYRKMAPLLRQQPYINEVIVMENWYRTGSPHGDIPWESPPPPYEYEHIVHLGYRCFPDRQLMRFVAHQQGITLPDQPYPFLKIPDNSVRSSNVVSVGFATHPPWPSKISLVDELKRLLPEVQFIDLNLLEWHDLPPLLATSLCFLGCRSALAVCAFGCGTKCLIFEPCHYRWDPIFGHGGGGAEDVGVWNSGDVYHEIIEMQKK